MAMLTKILNINKIKFFKLQFTQKNNSVGKKGDLKKIYKYNYLFKTNFQSDFSKIFQI